MTRRVPRLKSGLEARRIESVRAALPILIAVLASPGAAVSQGLAIEPRFDAAGLFHEGVAPVKVGQLWGLIDRSGSWVVEPRYEAVLGGSDGRFAIMDGRRWGYVTTGGTLVISPRFESARPFSEGAAAVKEGGRWGYVLADGSYLQPPAFDQAGDIDSGFSLTIRHGRCEVFLRTGERVSDDSDEGSNECQLPHNVVRSGALEVQENSEGMGILRVGDRRYYCDGGRISESYYVECFGGFTIARPYSQGLAAVSEGPDRWIFIDRDGRQAIGAAFDGAREFTSGVAPAAVQGKWGYIDRQGRFLVSPRFDRAYSFNEGYAVVRQGDERGFLEMDLSGKIAVYVEPRFEDVFQFAEGLAPVKLNGQWGYLAARRQPEQRQVRAVTDLTP